MNEYSAASPSMNDQWLGKTLFSCVRMRPGTVVPDIGSVQSLLHVLTDRQMPWWGW